ncbi:MULTISPECIES: tetratricopeptide repeat protein [Acinetobacter]|uniref:tetratricopeptide repeat protein n=1 Tax=Acinetobacter TaxID=469 RepID=UPI0002AEA8E0|nr:MULTISPECIES: tetratricopeptide repeat protein [Acinetobacter]ELW89021.1 tetratricopeptide repeat protein [Acinetobacter sp. WC-743]MBJ8427429.1 tetratricopeptide repeat protein [Acinetobacter bereziniae]MBJ8473720.1 tetratricopeptide repeat protein [Acinetobacter bereziniae]
MNLEEANNFFKQALEAKQNNRIDKAIELLSQIKKSSDDLKKVYARAQFNLGFLLKKQNRLVEAEEAYKNVLREDQAELYASAQLNLGILIKKQERFSEAEQAYKNVLREDRADAYANAQLNLGLLFNSQKRIEEAERAYKNVLREDQVEAYSAAQLNLGILLYNLKSFKEAEEAYKNVKHIDSAENYAYSQLRLGFLYYEQNKIELSKKYFSKAKRIDSGLAYAYAQYGLWIITKNVIYLKHINLIDNKKRYYTAQFKLGEIEYSSDKPRLDNILDYWNNISENSEWYSKIYYKKYLINKIINIQKDLSTKLVEIFKKVDSLLNYLIIKNENEDLIAHYTSPSVAKLLIANNICGHYNSSRMRLNTIDLMNDPTEGEILNSFLSISSDLITTNDQAFMGCFTLHHDSLNQFRLYGKEDQKEGSGLSLILTEQFFEQENSFSNIRLQNTNNSISEIIAFGEVEKNNRNIETSSVDESSNSKVIEKLPLYRCIYIDPDSKLIEISHREEWTFCREAKSSKSDKWEKYLKDIKKLRDQVREEFQNLENLIKPLYQKISENIKKYTNEAELLAEILLPLRFLVKHMAFKEEQECRVVYVTQWDDHFVQYDENLKRFYIDYGQDVVTHLKKIYLGPHALREKNMFEYLCSHAKQNNRTEHEVKIKTSHNPLR